MFSGLNRCFTTLPKFRQLLCVRIKLRPIRKVLWKLLGRFSLEWSYKQLLDEVFVISRIIKVEVRVISRSRRLRLITLTETLIILDITKTESNNCFIIHWTNAKTWKSCFCFFTDGKQHESREVDMITLGNHALRAQPTDYSLICRYRLVNNL